MRSINIGVKDTDSDQVILQKRLLGLMGQGTVIPGLIWSYLYYVSGEPIAASLTFLYCLLAFIGFIFYMRNPDRYTQCFLLLRVEIFLIPVALTMVLGGLYLSSFVIVWAFTAPLTSLLVEGKHRAHIWFGCFVLVLLIFVFLPPLRGSNNFSEDFIITFTVVNIIGMSVPTYFTAHYAIDQRRKFMTLLQEEKNRNDELLLNVLPESVIPTLHEKEPYVKEFDDVSVLFADIVGFTKLTEQIGAKEMLDILNEIFSHFDSLLETHRAEKIRTIGDNYMAVVGAPVSETDHAYLIVTMAQKMLHCLEKTQIKKHDISFRIGINSGSVVAGVIGKQKFHFDVWGDMVNLGSRFESQGIPGRIQIGKATYEKVKDRIQCESRGEIDIKGKGKLETFLVL